MLCLLIYRFGILENHVLFYALNIRENQFIRLKSSGNNSSSF